MKEEKEVQREERRGRRNRWRNRFLSSHKNRFPYKNNRDQVICFYFIFHDPENKNFSYAGDPKFDLIILKEDSSYSITVIKFSEISKTEIIENLSLVLFVNQCSSYVVDLRKQWHDSRVGCQLLKR